MLPFPPFELARPGSLRELLQRLEEPDARILAGGTDLMPNLKHRIEKPPVLVSLKGVQELNGIVENEDGITIGATTTLSEVAAHPIVSERYPALRDACRTVGTSTVQEMGTLGGNLMLDTRCRYLNQPDGWRTAIGGCLKCEGNVCHVARTGSGCYAAHSADTVPVLWLMGARLRIAALTHERELELPELYTTDGIRRHTLRRGELLHSIHLPRPRGFVAHRKLRTRGAIDYPLLLTAVRREGNGASAVLSALGPQPILVQAAVAADLPEKAWAAAKPLNTHTASTSWRKHMVRVEVKRALESAVTLALQ
jgi:4-hydroxybenzoyl-CoA reductase subunit beta